MKGYIKAITVAMLLTGAAGATWAKGIKTIKEKVPIKFSVPPIERTIPKEETYKFKFPRQLTYFDEKRFRDFATGFCDVDGTVRTQSRRMLAKKILGDVPTDYTFELVTTGIKKINRINAPYKSYRYKEGFVQDFEYSFPCTLRIYHKDSLVKELLLDDGTSMHKKTFFKDFRIEAENDQQPYQGFPSVEAIEANLKPDSPAISKFNFLVEYLQYKENFEKACFAIINFYGNFDFKTAIPVELVGEDDAATYPELNAEATNLVNTLKQTLTFEDMAKNAAAFAKSADYFEKYAKTEGIDKRLKLMCMRNAAIANTMLSNTDKAFQQIKEFDKLDGSIFSSLRSVLFDMYNTVSAYSFYKSVANGEVVEDISLNERFDKDQRAIEAYEQLQRDKEKQAQLMQNQAEAKALAEKMSKRNFIDVQTKVYYADKTVGTGIGTFIFYALDSEGNVLKSCGKMFTVQDTPKPMVCDLHNIEKIEIMDKDGNQHIFVPTTIIPTSKQRVATVLFDKKLFNDRILVDVATIDNDFIFAMDRTDPEDKSLVLLPLVHNNHAKSYRLRDILKDSTYPNWMKPNAKIEEAINNGLICNDEPGRKTLMTVLRMEKLPAEDL